MKRHWLNLLFLFCWCGAGFALFNRPTGPDSDQLANQPVRIVSTAPNLTEILFALGLTEQITGVTQHSDYPPAAQEKPKIGTFWQPNIEAIIAGRPELILTLGFSRQTDTATRLKRLGYPCLTVNIETIPELFQAVNTIGSATGRMAEAKKLTRTMQMKLDHISSLTTNKELIKVLWVIQREPLRIAGRKTFINEIITLAGGQNAIGPTLHKYPPIGAEQILRCQPDVIIEPAMTQADKTEQHNTAVKYWSRYPNIPAVKNNRIYVIDSAPVLRLGPRTCQGVETVAQCLRPQLFDN